MPFDTKIMYMLNDAETPFSVLLQNNSDVNYDHKTIVYHTVKITHTTINNSIGQSVEMKIKMLRLKRASRHIKFSDYKYVKYNN